MTLERFYEWLRTVTVTGGGSMIVKINYKYDCESCYTETNEIMTWDYHTNTWIWESDWNEGQEDIIIIGYTWLEDVTIKNIF